MSADVKVLDGVKVVELSNCYSASLCAHYLAQLGAKVIKINRPSGCCFKVNPDLYKIINGNKGSSSIDLKTEEGAAHFLELAKNADIIIESFKPGFLDGMNVGYKKISIINPRVVFASITPYGQFGPLSRTIGTEYNYLALSGILTSNIVESDVSAIGGLPVAEVAGGALTSALSIVSALFAAQKSGRGSYLDASILDGAVALQHHGLSLLAFSDKKPTRNTDFFSCGLPNQNVYKCKDGRFLTIGAMDPGVFSNFLHLLKLEHNLYDFPDGENQNKYLKDRIASRLRQEPLSYWMQRLGPHNVCVTPVLTLKESINSSHSKERSIVSDDSGYLSFRFPVLFH